MRTNTDVPETFASLRAVLILLGTLRLSAFVRLRACALQQDSGKTRVLWSEKTTVCRIFNCKRAFEAIRPSACASSRFERRYAASFPQTCSAFLRLPELLILRLLSASGNRAVAAQRRGRAVEPQPCAHAEASAT